MGINNEELLHKFVRTGMIMRHIDDEKPCKPHGHGHGPGEGKGCCPHGHRGEEEARIEGEKAVEHGRKGHGPHGHGPHGFEGCCHEGHGSHGHGPEGHGPHGHGKRCGKRRGQARVITMVAMKEGINQKDLAFLLGIRPQTLGEMLRRLEERGLVDRKKSETDARVMEVYLTDEGRARAEEIAERRKLAASDLFSVLTDDEKEQLSAILDKLGAELDKYRPKHHRDAAEAETGETADEPQEQE